MDDDSGDESLRLMIARLRAFGAGAPEAVAREAAPLVETEAKKTAAAGTDPYGDAWPPKLDGTRALPNAAEFVTAHALGPVVQIKVTGGYAIQHVLRGKTRRAVIPEAAKGIPKPIADALKEGATRAFKKATGQ